MAYYRTCPDCGALLDPGEKCSCVEIAEQLRKKYELLTAIGNDGQIEIGGMSDDISHRSTREKY